MDMVAVVVPGAIQCFTDHVYSDLDTIGLFEYFCRDAYTTNLRIDGDGASGVSEFYAPDVHEHDMLSDR
jgi:hypothetical protein